MPLNDFPLRFAHSLQRLAAPRRAYRFTLVLALGATLALAACDFSSTVLDKEPQDQISENTVFSDPNLVDSYMFEAYADLNIQHGYGKSTFNSWRWEALGAEYVTGATWQATYHGALSVPDAGGAHWILTKWDYDNVRRVNTIIEKLRASERLDEAFVRTRVAEARFIRAFIYYNLVKRYGGVPLITKVQSLSTPRDSIFVKRADEKEIWDFVASELDAVAGDLPEDPSGREGRATKWAALGLKSRAMLFAASVAQFGEVMTAGSGEGSVQLGIPASEADAYWTQALDAAETVIEESPHALYNEYPDDPAKNYQHLFITEAAENPEVIFAELFDGDQKGHSNTFHNLPMEYAKSWGANAGATWTVVQLFNNEDGSSMKLSEAELTSQLWSAEELFGQRDPRFRGSVLYPEATFRDSMITFHTSTMRGGEKLTRENAGYLDGGWPASAPPRNYTRTGLLVKKRTRLDNVPNQLNTDGTDYIDMRLGEMYMNAAEAAFELGQSGKALGYVNTIRERAGMPLFESASRENIRAERQRELVLEQRRYWDLRRWRTAVEELDGLRVKGMRFDYDWDAKKYQVRLVNAEGRPRVFQERHYYLPLGADRLAQNPALVENPGY